MCDSISIYLSLSISVSLSRTHTIHTNTLRLARSLSLSRLSDQRVPRPRVEIYSAAQSASAETQLAHEELLAGLVGPGGPGATATDGQRRRRRRRRRRRWRRRRRRRNHRTTHGMPFQSFVLVEIAMYVLHTRSPRPNDRPPVPFPVTPTGSTRRPLDDGNGSVFLSFSVPG